MEKYEKSVVILAGGLGKRLGYRSKAFLEYKGKPFIEYILEKVGNFKEIIIVSNEPKKYENYKNIRVVEDIVKGIGPLGGIYTGLKNSYYDEVLVLSCDTPFVNKNFLNYLGEISGNYTAAVPRSGKNREPLCALYKKELIKNIEEAIESKEFRIVSAFDWDSLIWIDLEEFENSSEILESFFNVNTPEDLEKVMG